MLKIAAIMCVYNETEIISDCIENLSRNSIDVFVLDDNSSDDTRLKVAQKFDQAVYGLLKFNSGRDKDYSQSRNMIAIERICNLLDYDWYIYIDADEVRESPRPGYTLRQAIEEADSLGYHVINFKVFNFRPTLEDVHLNTPYTQFNYYEGSGDYDVRQLKAWKHDTSLDLHTHAGHYPIFNEQKRLYPTRFILKHFPIRGPKHYLKKVINERKRRFSAQEIAAGWHVQYNNMPQDSCPTWNRSDLKLFKLQAEQDILLYESEICNKLTFNQHSGFFDYELTLNERTVSIIRTYGEQLGFSHEKLVSLVNGAVMLRRDLIALNRLDSFQVPDLSIDQFSALILIASIDYLEGRPLLFTKMQVFFPKPRTLHGDVSWSPQVHQN